MTCTDILGCDMDDWSDEELIKPVVTPTPPESVTEDEREEEEMEDEDEGEGSSGMTAKQLAR